MLLGPIRTLIADDEGVIREGLRAFLELDRQIEIVGAATNGRQAIQMAICLRPDVLILDIDLHDIDGIEVVRQIYAAVPAIQVICLSPVAKSDPTNVVRTIPYHLKVIHTKTMTSRQLLDSIHGVVSHMALLNSC